MKFKWETFALKMFPIMINNSMYEKCNIFISYNIIFSYICKRAGNVITRFNDLFYRF